MVGDVISRGHTLFSLSEQPYNDIFFRKKIL